MELRNFGKTGLKTSLLGFGGFHLLEIPSQDAENLLNAYLDAGGNYIETASGYGRGESERKIGRGVGRRRSEFILASKIDSRTREAAAREIDESLRNLQTSYLDILLMHAVSSMDELNTILGEGGAMEAALEAKKAGKIRFIGISMHGWPGTLIEALHRFDFDAVMSTINYYDRFNFPEIENTLLPLAAEKQAGVILMKSLGDGYLYRSAEQAFRYSCSQPVSVVVAGINNQKMLEDDLRYAENFTPMTREEEEELFRNASELGDYVCRQCGKCSCPKGIDLPAIFACEGVFDRQMFRGRVSDTADYALMERLRFWFQQQELAKARYAELPVKADACNGCGKCLKQCPYGIDIPYKLHLCDYKLAGRDIF